MEVAIYYDERLFKTFSSFVNKNITPPSDYKTLNYVSVGNWLETHGKGDVLLFLQDEIPYFAFNATYSSLFYLDNKLRTFLKKGGTVVWLGDVPFFYRVKCVKENVKEKIIESVKSADLPEFFKNKFIEVFSDGEETCFRDIVYYYHIDDNFSIRFVGYFTDYLKFLDLGSICYMKDKVEGDITITGRLLGYDEKSMLRPIRLKGHIFIPLTYAKLRMPACIGEYSGSWIRQVGKGYFVRLFDAGVSKEEEVNKAIEIGKKIATLRT